MSRNLTIEQAIALGIQHHNAGQLAQAEQIYQQVLQQYPNHPDALHLMGLLAQQAGKLGSAVEFIAKAILGNPSAAVYPSNLAEVLRKLGLLDEAEVTGNRAVKLAPDFAPAHANLGIIYYDQKRWDHAAESLHRALELDPSLLALLPVLSTVLIQKGEPAKAIEVARRAVAPMPGDAASRNCLGLALQANDMHAEAETEFRRAIEIDPRFAEAQRNLGLLHRRKGDVAEAVRCWNLAVAAQPDHADANWNLSLGLLALGDYSRGWPLYEWRFRSDHTRHMLRDFPVPRWDGSDLKGKTILLYSEQGFGDVVQFVRFVPQLRAAGAKVILQVPRELVRLLKGAAGVDQVISNDDPVPSIDTQQALLSLPWILRTTLQTLPANVPYIQVDPGLKQKWAARIGSQTGKYKVGLVWAGRPRHAEDTERSLSPELLRVLGEVSDVRFFSLQKGDAAKQIGETGLQLVDLSHELIDFADTAAAIANMDLLISVDTAPVHIAGAVGAKVWTLLPFAADYRWMLDREDSPWYPTMRLFRQRTRDDWRDVIDHVQKALHELAPQKR